MKSLSDRFIEEAVKRGYFASEEGKVFNPEGEEVRLHSSKTGHLRLTLYLSGLNERGSQSVLAHRLIAYFFFGEEIFNHRLVRHLNDVPYDNRRENLQPGSYKDNRADIPKEVLSSIAKRKASVFIERSRSLTNEEIRKMRYYRSLFGTPYKKLAEAFKVSSMTAFRACTRKSWGDVV